MRKGYLSILGIVLLLFMVSGLAMGEELSVADIVEKANLTAYYSGNDGRSEVEMTITDNQGRKRTREFVILRRDVAEGAEQQFYVYFKKPSDVRKMVFMVHKQIGKDDDRWFYLPALDLVKRIAASDKRTSFAGSHFFYEDVSGRAVTEDHHELIDTTESMYVLKNTPKDPDSVEFSAYTVWIDKKTFMPIKAEYLDKKGDKYRVVEAVRIEMIDDIPTVTKSKVTDLLSGGQTVSEFKSIKYNIGLKEDIFTERYLRRAPKAVRK